MVNIIIRIPYKQVKDIRKEYEDAYEKGLELNFKTGKLPKMILEGEERVFFAWSEDPNDSTNGYIWGYHVLHDLEEEREAFECLTTGTSWGKGKYIIRDGESLIWLDNPIPIKLKGRWAWRYVRKEDGLNDFLPMEIGGSVQKVAKTRPRDECGYCGTTKNLKSFSFGGMKFCKKCYRMGRHTEYVENVKKARGY